MPGPFKTQGETQQIAEVQLRGGFTPDTGIQDAVKQIANLAVSSVTDNYKEQLQNDIKDKTQSIKDALLASSNPAIAQSMFRKEALANPITAQAFEDFNRIKTAAAQGVLPQQFALERLAVIQNQAISNAPEFEQEIRAAMQQATGMNPEASLFAQLMSTQKKQLSPEEKAQQELAAEAFKNGLTVEQQTEINHSVALAQLETSRLNRKKAQGEYALPDLAADVNNQTGAMFLTLMGQVRKQTIAGGGLTPDFIAAFKQQGAQLVSATLARLQADSKNLAPDQVASALAPILKLQEQFNGMLDDGSLQALTTSNNTLDKAIKEGAVLSMPKYGTAWAFGGQQGFLEMLKWLDKAGSPQSQALLENLSDDAKTAFTLDRVVSQYGLLGSGKTPVTVEDKNARAIAATIVMGTSGMKDEQYNTAVQDLSAIDESLTWSAFGSKKVIAATAQSKSLQATMVNLQQTTTANLATEYLQVTSMPLITPDRFIMEDGKLTFKTDPLTDFGGINNEAAGEARAFVERFNRANEISRAHMRAGTLPASRYSDTQGYWDTIVNAAKDITTPPANDKPDNSKPAVIRWGRDANGKPVRLDN